MGHRNIQNTLRYINLEQAVFKDSTDRFHVRVVDSIEDACKCLEVGYEYVMDMNGKKLLRKESKSTFNTRKPQLRVANSDKAKMLL